MSSKAAQNVRGAAVYKKKDGTLSISRNQKSIIWVPLQPRDAASSVTIEVANITNLQQTPESAAKVMLKIFDKSPDAAESVTHLFHFNSATNPRGEANAIKDVLTNLISAIKADDVTVPRANSSGPASAAMAIASAVKSGSGTNRWYDDAQLKTDIELQQSLMKKDPSLHRTYMESRRTKPDTISDSQFNSQFWSTRTNLLRAHAVETNQKRGEYNVLSAVKPRQVDGELKMNITQEQIQLIFSQHPLVKRVYDENVPKLNETDFWSRFFLSRLFKVLRGEKVTDADASDPTFDRYLSASNDDNRSQQLLAAHIPNIIDLEKNEENQGGNKSGNRQDLHMRPGLPRDVPILRVLNSLSEKIMAHVAPSDVNPAEPIGMDEETWNSLALRDLQGDPDENRIILKVKEQSQFFSNEKSEVSAEAEQYAQQVPSEVLYELQSDIDPTLMDSDAVGGLNLQIAIGVNEESDSEDEEKINHVGSKASLLDAQKQIFEGIKARRTEIDGSSSESSLSGLSQKIFDRLTLTHATTTEFLHHFWEAFLSGNPDRAGELAKMIETLDRAMDRINAVAADAEKEKEDVIQRHRKHIMDVYEKTRKKIKWDANSVGGGEKVVREMMAPTIKTLEKASKEYKKALDLAKAEGIDPS
jgi:transcription initiation factor TFIIH subunit 1